MDENNTFHVKVNMPDLPDKEILGVLIISSKQKVIEFSENPYGKMSIKTIPIMFCYSKRQTFTLIQSVLSKSNENKVSYIINELYDGLVDDLFDSKKYLSLTAEVTNLSNWIPPKLINFFHKSEEKSLLSVDLGNEVVIEHVLSDEYYLKIFLKPRFVLKVGDVRIFEDVSVSVHTTELTSRSKLFTAYYSLLNFYTLFLTSIPSTKNLSFNKENETINLVINEPDLEESRFDVLLQYDEVEDFNKLVQNYFLQLDKYNQVVSLWEAGLKSNNSEVIFLYLTQSIEVLHKYFYEFDPALRLQIKQEVEAEFEVNIRQEWTNMMRYFHFFNLLENVGLVLKFPLGKKEFLNHLLDSRNFYTHYDDKVFVWTAFQLYEMNKVIRIWVRSLILLTLGTQTEKVQNVIKREYYHSLENDITKNEFSMWFANKEA